MIQERLSKAFNKLLEKTGTSISVVYFNESIGSVYDDDLTLSVSGTTWISGIVMPLNGLDGSQDSVLMEQGKLLTNDKKVYTSGNLMFTGSTYQVKVQIGSPTGDQYSVIPIGTYSPEVEGYKIYKRTYLRFITNGSLIGQ